MMALLKDGYAYRAKTKSCIKYYFDSIPDNLSEDALFLLIMLAEIANDENVLVLRKKRKSKFSSVVYEPYTREEIRERLRYPMGVNKFDRCWRELRKSCIKQVKYYNFKAWAINPAVVSRCRYIPIWLYEEFSESIDPHLSRIALKKMQEKINSLED